LSHLADEFYTAILEVRAVQQEQATLPGHAATGWRGLGPLEKLRVGFRFGWKK